MESLQQFVPRLRAIGIEIPFPRLDIHSKSGRLTAARA